MCNKDTPKIDWNYKRSPQNIGKLATCGLWEAELAYSEIYSPGLVFLTPNKDKEKDFPKQLGDTSQDGSIIHSIPQPTELFCLIDEISARMRKLSCLCCDLDKKCKCENVYLVCLNENERKHPVHFRLLPRYWHDRHLMEQVDDTGNTNDGLALMSLWRQQNLRRRHHKEWGNWPPSRKDKEGKDDAWIQYAINIKQQLLPNCQSK